MVRTGDSSTRVGRDAAADTNGATTGAPDSGVGQTVRDAVAAITDTLFGGDDGALSNPVPDALAQTCGDCTVPANLRVVTADTDSNQAARGRFTIDSIPSASWSTKLVATGPLFVTAFVPSSSVMYLYTVASNESCTNDPAAATDEAVIDIGTSGPHWQHLTSNGEAAAAGRIFIASGEKLCARTTQIGGAYWSGFRPYN